MTAIDYQPLVDKYFDIIEVSHFDFNEDSELPIDPAELCLILPPDLVSEYRATHNVTEGFPDGVNFWKATNLRQRLIDRDDHLGSPVLFSRVMGNLDGLIYTQFGMLGSTSLEVIQDFTKEELAYYDRNSSFE